MIPSPRHFVITTDSLIDLRLILGVSLSFDSIKLFGFQKTILSRKHLALWDSRLPLRNSLGFEFLNLWAAGCPTNILLEHEVQGLGKPSFVVVGAVSH